jgi:two-component system OmpR family response regulator
MQTAELSMFIIEDDAKFRDTFIDVMSLRGIEARGAGTGAEGLRALQGLQPTVIVLDVQLPDVHGFDLCRRIKRIAAFKDTPVIFLSASSRYMDARDRVEGLLAGASLFLAKPITMDKLWVQIEQLLKQR